MYCNYSSNNLFIRNNYFTRPFMTCMPMPMPMFSCFGPRPIFSPWFNNWNTPGDYMALMSGLSQFGNLTSRINSGSNSPYAGQSQISNNETVRQREPRIVIKKTVPPALKRRVKETLGRDFLQKTREIARKIKCSTNDLLALMNNESGLDPQAVNKSSNATGLIQFMPSTAKDLGTSVEELKQMTAQEQLVYVEKYLVNAKKAAGFADKTKLQAGDLYALTLYPARATKNIVVDSAVSLSAYNGNKGLDLDGDGVISKADLAQRLESSQINYLT